MNERLRGILLSALLLISVIIGITAFMISLAKTSDLTLPPRMKYGIVIDAGSSHTSLYVYQWPSDKKNSTGIVSQAHVCNVQGGGISSYTDEPYKAGKSLERCLNEAMNIIPKDRQAETPVYLGATAGMRLLRLEDAEVADKVLIEVSKTIKRYRVDFRGARIITGAEEGSYGWITINYLMESFMKYSFSGQWIRPIYNKIYGALDLGGDFTQISFIPKGTIEDPKESATFNLYGFPYTIYTHSFLCYGQDQVLKQMLVKAIAGQDLEKPITVPCYPKKYTETIPLRSLYQSPCITSAATPTLVKQVTLEGTGDAAQCRALVKGILNFAGCPTPGSCSFDGVYQPPVVGHFLAFSEYFYTFDFLNLTSGQRLPAVTTGIETYCARDWAEITAAYPGAKTKRLRDYCGSGNYILTLLLDAYKFTEDSWGSISFLKKAENTDIGWTLGYMLNLTNMIPSENLIPVKAQLKDVWIAAIFFVCLSLVLILLMMFVHCHKRQAIF
ncbi:ectonucleoside triphosphate diphosphohydrolase 8-like [Ascaphus truei]|uniref:ectonucleoside triphosphate diphosphohydrolase 8-like n=1 Tax=Ascaphus truei TaxID=8439 RepID=UPI003F59BC6E